MRTGKASPNNTLWIAVLIQRSAMTRSLYRCRGMSFTVVTEACKVTFTSGPTKTEEFWLKMLKDTGCFLNSVFLVKKSFEVIFGSKNVIYFEAEKLI